MTNLTDMFSSWHFPHGMGLRFLDQGPVKSSVIMLGLLGWLLVTQIPDRQTFAFCGGIYFQTCWTNVLHIDRPLVFRAGVLPHARVVSSQTSTATSPQASAPDRSSEVSLKEDLCSGPLRLQVAGERSCKPAVLADALVQDDVLAGL